MDRRYTGRFDGYLGFDFLKKHRAIIDLHNGILKLHAFEDKEKTKKKVSFATNEKTIIDEINTDDNIDETKEKQLKIVARKHPTPLEVNVVVSNETQQENQINENEQINQTQQINKSFYQMKKLINHQSKLLLLNHQP